MNNINKKHIRFLGIICALVIFFFAGYSLCAEEKKDWRFKGALAALHDSNNEVQAKALTKLAELGYLESIPDDSYIFEIERFLKNKSWEFTWNDNDDIPKKLINLTELTKESIPLIGIFLKHNNPVIRNAAIESLNNFNKTAQSSIPKLKKFLSHENAEVRCATIESVGKLGETIEDSYFNKIDRFERDGDVGDSMQNAYNQLKNIAKLYLEQIAYLLGKDPDATVRISAIKVLGRIKGKELVSPYIRKIVASLKDQDARVRELAIEILSNLGEAENYILEVKSLLNDESPIIRKIAIEILGYHEEYIPEIIACLKDNDFDVLSAAVLSLSKFTLTEEDIDQIRKISMDKKLGFHETILAIANFLDSLRQKDFKQILEMLKNKNTDPIVRLAIFSILCSDIENLKEYIPVVEDCLNDDNPDVVIAAIQTIEKLGAKQSIRKLERFLENKNPSVCLAAIDALINLGDREISKEAFLSIRQILTHQDAIVRFAGLELLGFLSKQSGEYYTEILETLDHELDPFVHAAIINAIGIQTEKAQDYIRNLVVRLDDRENPLILSTVIETLGNLASSEQGSGFLDDYSIDKIATLLKYENPQVCIAAIRALGNIGGYAKNYLPPIIKVLQDHKNNRDIQKSSVEALSKLGKLDIKYIFEIIEPIYSDFSLLVDLRFLAHFLGAGDQNIEILLRRIENSHPGSEKISSKDLFNELTIFSSIWDDTKHYQNIRSILAKNIYALINANKKYLNSKNLEIIRILLKQFKSDENISVESQHVENIVREIEIKDKIYQITKVILVLILLYILFWVILIYKYSSSKFIRKIFFWKPFIRRILGMFYIEKFVIFFLRKYLIRPFRNALLCDINSDEIKYFDKSVVKYQDKTQEITQAIP